MKISLLDHGSIVSYGNQKDKNRGQSVSQRPVLASYPKATRVPNNTLKAYYCNDISFGRTKAEHLINGAHVAKNGEVFFKLFTFPDAKEVSVIIKDKGEHLLKKLSDGNFATKLPHFIAQDGDKYCFKITKGNGSVIECKDPYAMKQENPMEKFSTIYDHHKFKWTDSSWKNAPERISHRSNRHLDDLKICEVNIATISKKGDFKSAQKYIDKVAKEGNFNAIEIMPVENTYSYNWGYDGVDKFAVQDSFLGGPDGLKEFVDYAHKKKLNVIMDLVPNHIGPDGNFLKDAGPYITADKAGPWGDKFNVEGDPKNNGYVRDYLSNMCLNWVNNYHCDGLRLDMTKAIAESNSTMKQIAMEVHYHNPDAVLIAEDGRGNLADITKPLSPTEEGIGMTENDHASQIIKATQNQLPLKNVGFDSEWNFPYFHALNEATYGNGNMKEFDYWVKNSGNRVKYAMSHDEIGNMDGTRLICKIAKEKLGIFKKISGSNDSDKHQKAAHATQAILTSKVTGQYDKMSQPERIQFLKEHNVNADVTPQEVDKALASSLAQNRLAMGHTFITPGPKMIFQGDEEANLSYFKFFREFSPGGREDDLRYLPEKGYEPGYKAFMDSKLDSINYSDAYKDTMAKMRNYMTDLSKLSEENPALKNGRIENTIVHEGSKLHATHLKKDNNEIFTISNFKDASYGNNYGIVFPKGEWKEVLNSNDVKYAGDGKNLNASSIRSNGNNQSNISIPANSLMVFKKVS